ncbi:MAG: toprim domain-containing protein [Burkholderiales bacterium]|nr:MAG: toprim domain-containing protein [Burkholderiales bacterium]
MARIPEAEIARLKSEVSVERLIEAAGIELKQAGKDLLGRCPWHEDDSASLVVTPAKNLWHCFGCGLGGGPIDWVIKKNGVSFRHAVELLRADRSLAAGDGAGGVKRSRLARLPSPVALDAGEQELLNQIIGYYHETLLASPEALAYLDKRGIGSLELIERHRLGFANRTLGLRLPVGQVKAGAEIRGRLQKIGLLRASGHEHFNGCLVVPVFGAAGKVTEVYGRKITEGVNPPLHLYLPGPHRGVWNESALQASPEIILCEALIDALTFYCAGYRNVTSAYGAEGFTDDLLEAFKRHGTRRVLIAFDRDEAGERGAEKVADKLIAAGIECFRIQFPKGMDANEYALKLTPAAKSLGLAIRKAVWLGKGAAPEEAPGQHVEDITLEAALVGPLQPDPSSVPDTDTELAAPSSLAASPAVPPAPAADDPAQVSDDEIVMSFGERRYRVRGLAKNLSYETLKVNVLVSKADAYYVDSFELYAAKSRGQYIAQAARELAVREEIVKADLGRLLLKLEALQDTRIKEALKVEPAAPALSEAEAHEALALLRAPDLITRIIKGFEAAGLVGEATNKLVGYLAATSRLLDAPLAVVVQSSSAAGKSSLMDAVLAFIPEEERIKYSAMTGQSLFYMGETNLKHKILAIAEEEGASRAAYALKLLQSEGELTIASTGKCPTTGNLITQQYRVEGPVMIFLTTTAIEIDEELLNRCLVLSVDEGREQTEAIHRRQRAKRTLAGLAARQDKARLLALHQNAQRLLRPLAVVNPYADRLTFLADKTRTRRDHEKYLTLIDTIALLHQHQRPIQTLRTGGEVVEYIEATAEDIAQANALAHEVLGRSLDDLPPQTRRLLLLIDGMVKAAMVAQQLPRTEIRFTRKTVREATGWSDFQVKTHMQKLTELEYLLAHRGGRGQCFEYELLYDGDGAAGPYLSGLLDAASLAYDEKKEHRQAGKEGSRSPQGGVKEAPKRAGPSPEEAHGMGVSSRLPEPAPQTAVHRGNGKWPSYALLPLAAGAAS